MDTAQFIREHQGYECMTRSVAVTLVETPDGYLLARAFGPAGEAYSASRTSSDALGAAAAAASYGDYHPATEGAFESPMGALEYARWLNTLG